MADPSDEPGVHFPLRAGRRGSTPTSRGVLADSVAGIDPELAERIRSADGWRTHYVDHVVAVTEASALSPATADEIADEGLASLRRRMVLVDADGAETPLAEAAIDRPGEEPPFATESVQGTERPITELVVPYRGSGLSGEALLAQLDAWVECGTVEPSFATAVGEVIDHPEWLALPGRRVALIGAGAEMGPLEALLSWGVDVLAIDLPRSRAWRYKRGLATKGAGRLAFPISRDGDAGADVVHQLGPVLQWLRREGGDAPLVLGMHAYADAGAHVQVSAATDALIEQLGAERGVDGLATAWLATPTDAFVVPPEVVAAARESYARRSGVIRWGQRPLRWLSRSKLYAPAYRQAASGAGGIADILVPQQGPSYAIAKRLQRWSGLAAQAAGRTVSFNVAPATWTRSVTKNPVLAAAYRGADRFGVEVFPAETTRALMAALLVRDLSAPPPSRSHPEELFSDQAAHGGLWRAGYDPKTVLGIAALTGLPGSLRDRLSRSR